MGGDKDTEKTDTGPRGSDKTLLKRWIEKMENNPFFASIMLAGIIILALAGFWTQISALFVHKPKIADTVQAAKPDVPAKGIARPDSLIAADDHVHTVAYNSIADTASTKSGKNISTPKTKGKKGFKEYVDIENHEYTYEELKTLDEKLLKTDPANFERNYELATILADHNDFKNAKKYFEKALEVRPDHFSTNYRYAVILHYHLNDFALAKKHYEKALETENSSNAQYDYATLLYEKLHDVTNAKAHYEAALAADHNNTNAQIGYAGLLCAKLHDTVAARKYYDDALRGSRFFSAKAQIDYASLLANKNETEEAKKHFMFALDREPNNGLVHYYYALFLSQKMNKKEDGLANYNIAVRLNSSLKSKAMDDYFGVN